MLDEPSLGLAPMIVRDLQDRAGAERKGRATVLVVEQDARIAPGCVDRLCARGWARYRRASDELPGERVGQAELPGY
jgi:ABC-type branched-subunit amino acid transport system ATPase component